MLTFALLFIIPNRTVRELTLDVENWNASGADRQSEPIVASRH
jgi:hypothetical protein